MIALDDLHKTLVKLELFSEDQSSARRFENDDKDQHESHRTERGDFWHILREAIVKKLRLNDVQ